ncbi:uncharacterized protein [Triticum aestivum]|uniref:uncharacterized protein isoform X1 n=2 Tax=Triticum aestivum TaxID=4565 RepID=UPI001D0288C3|nr:uncharacterized protein LOC123046646 isoform X1 [Triticum aestivum]
MYACLKVVESANSVQNQDLSDATSFAEINSPMLLIDDASTPKKKQAFSQEGSLYKPQCDEELKPKVGMLFDDIGSVMEFYKTYAHHVGFGVRLGQQKIVDNVLLWKRFLCAKEGFRPEKGMVVVDHSKKRQKAQVLAARDDCDVQDTENREGIKIMFVSDQYKKIREVSYDTISMTAKCSCKLFESNGIMCRHIIRVLRGAKINELPRIYVLKRWERNCKRDIIFDGEGNILEENLIDPVDMAMKRKIALVRNKLEDLIRKTKGSMEGIEFLHTSLCNAEMALAHLVPAVACNTHENEESFIGSIIPKHVTIHTPTDINARGTCSRIKGHRDAVRSGSSEKKRRPGIHQKVARKCSICKEVVFHDARTCSKKQMTQQ